VDSAVAHEHGITVLSSGPVSLGGTDSYGSWESSLVFTYDAEDKILVGQGSYLIQLDGPPGAVGDITIFKLASNYLLGVPLLDGATGNTGDFEEAWYTNSAGTTQWDLATLPEHFDMGHSDDLRVWLTAALNQVDTAAMGEEPIDAAYKPSLDVSLVNLGAPGLEMILGGMLDMAQARNPYADNVGLTPVLLAESAVTSSSFGVTIVSEAHEDDGSL
jgi:hypothetical protein